MSSAKPGAVDPKKYKQEVSSKSKGKVGEWVRHTSSTGKEYYFNVTTHASQWEKPREWLEHEKKHGLVPSHPQPSSSSSQAKAQQHHQQQKDRDAHHSATSAGHSSFSHQSSQQQQLLQQQRDRERHYHQQQAASSALASSSATASTSAAAFGHSHAHSSHPTASTSQSAYGRAVASSSSQFHPAHSLHPTMSSSSSFHQQHLGGRQESGFHVSSSSTANSSSDLVGSQRHFPDIQYPTTSSAAIASTSAAARENRKPSEDLQAEDMDISPLDDDSPGPSLKVMGSSVTNIGASTSANIHARGGDVPGAHHSSYQSGYYHRTHPPSSATGNNGHGGNFRERDRERDRDFRERDRDRDRERDRERDVRDRDRDRERPDRDRDRERDRERDIRDRERDRYRDRDRDIRDRDYRDRGRGRERGRDRSERDTRERSRSKLRDERRSSSPDGTPERKHSGEAPGGLGSLAALTQADAEIPPLPQSLAMYFRDDLIAHVKNLPGDIFERQANKLSEELVTNYAFQLSKVSTELKMARSLVRLTEIQSTLIEQRILFIRQQMKALEGDDNAALLGVETIDT